jgi:hydrogenase nickel incorporation protein HypB
MRVDQNKCRGGCPIGNIAQEMGDLNEDFRKRLQTVYAGLQSSIAQLLDQAMSQGQLDMDVDTRELAGFIVENVGNLVCPAEFDTGAHASAMILSVPEGDDKPLKYPLMFTKCQALVVNKIDALDIFDFNLHLLRKRAGQLNLGMNVLPLSCKTGEGVHEWIQWLEVEMRSYGFCL